MFFNLKLFHINITILNKNKNMKVALKKKVMYETFKCKKELQDKILSMILKSKTDKIIYKGNPTDIDYKLMKKVLLDDYTQRIDPIEVRIKYTTVVESTEEQKFCLIYKE